MTLALIVLVVFLIVWFCDSTKKKEDKRTHREKTKTDVKRQDELWNENFIKVMSDIKEISHTIDVNGDNIMSIIESLFTKYDVPDTRTDEEKQTSCKRHLRLYKEGCRETDWNHQVDCMFARILHNEEPTKKQSSLYDLIWYYPWKPPAIDKPELFIGVPNTSTTVDGITYKYDAYGRASNIFATEPSRLILRICNLLTMRALDAEKLNYSWNRQESSWQQSGLRVQQYEENKKRYPWLYK